MMTQTLALLVDAYREMNSKKLFWITMILSLVVVVAFACFGVNENGISIVGLTIPVNMINSHTMPPELFYKIGYINFGVNFWLTWAATILALVSTAPIFPDFLAGGAIELVLSKPISRTRLFFTKYASGLIFVTMQVAVFSTACFLVIGLRGHVWDFKIFLAIPIVLCFFSYLFSLCTLFGVLTRSTIASLLLTLLAWFIIFLVSTAERITLTFRESTSMQAETATRRIKRLERETTEELRAKSPDDPAVQSHTYTPDELDAESESLVKARTTLRENDTLNHKLALANNILVDVRTFLPKTDETIGVLQRALITDAERKKFHIQVEAAPKTPRDRKREEEEKPSDRELGWHVEDLINSRSLGWVIGTSLAFEGLVLGFAAWRFRKRDF